LKLDEKSACVVVDEFSFIFIFDLMILVLKWLVARLVLIKLGVETCYWNTSYLLVFVVYIWNVISLSRISLM